MQKNYLSMPHRAFGAKWPKQRNTMPSLIALVVTIGVGLVCTSVNAGGDIQPRNGHWLAVMKFQSVSGCSGQMRKEIEADAEDEVLYSKVLTFPEPLDLNKLNEAWDVDVSWTRKNPNYWEGEMTETEGTLFGKVTTITKLNSKTVSDGLIDQQAVTTVILPPRLVRKFGASEPCVIYSDITHRLR